jgi:hypothetical protein
MLFLWIEALQFKSGCLEAMDKNLGGAIMLFLVPKSKLQTAPMHDRVLSMRSSATRKQSRGLKRIHQAKIRSRKAQVRARALGEPFEGFCLAKHVDPEALKRPLNLTRAKIPAEEAFKSRPTC